MQIDSKPDLCFKKHDSAVVVTDCMLLLQLCYACQYADGRRFESFPRKNEVTQVDRVAAHVQVRILLL